MDIIRISDFTKYYGKFAAVKNMNLSIRSGEVTGFVGKNGAGKTTTLRAVLDMIRPTYGKIEVFGLDSVTDNKQIKKRVGYMPAECEFYPGIRASDILNLSCAVSGVPYEEAEKLAEYFEVDIGRKTNELSLGNRKKISIIQALLKNPELLILDEPTSGFDPYMQNKFFKLIEKMKNEGASIFLSSHNLGEIEKYCDRVLIIKNGEIIDDLEMKKVRSQSRHRVTYTTKSGDKSSYEFRGDVNNLLLSLTKLDLESLEIRVSGIEDDFIKYYGEE